MSCHPVPVAVLVLLFAVNKEPLVAADTTTTTEVTLQADQTENPVSSGSLYAWSAWGPWSGCSRPCGGGVSVQERHCLPRDLSRQKKSRRRRKLLRPKDTKRNKRAIISAGPDCPGLGRRYHECNTLPCPGTARDARTEQCSMYDRRPFKGQYYTWEPYVDGNAPCILNCRPRGQRFYASLALVADGSPCSPVGRAARAVCVQGVCKDSESDLFNFLPNDVRGSSMDMRNTGTLNLVGPSSKKQKTDLTTFSYIKKPKRGVKVIRIEIYDAAQFPDVVGSICTCDAELCVQHVVKNILLDDIYKSVKEIAEKISSTIYI